jgi:MoCo/4Fe-4S cofactor protein with predicted Tat translocation signal
MEHEKNESFDLTAIREKLAGAKGQEFWRGLDEIAETEEFQLWVEDEFPNRSTLLQLDRRDFLKFMGAGMAMAGLAGCRSLPQDKIVPYVKQPEELTLGKPLIYASAVTFGGYARGVLVTSREGRPIKIEGNPGHPSTGTVGEIVKHGATDAITQALLLDLYDPDRLQNTQKDGSIAAYEDFLKVARDAVNQPAAAGTAPIRILTETVTSPTLADQIKSLQAKYPGVKWHQYEPVSGNNARLGSQAAFGQYINTVYHFDKADRILALDGDFFLNLAGSVRYAGDFMTRRRVNKDKQTMSRLYAVESTPTLTGANADHRLPLRASEIEGFARALLATLDSGSAAAPAGSEAFLKAVADDLKSAGSAALVVAGDGQSSAVHALAHAINAKLGSVGTTVSYIPAVEAQPEDQIASLKSLVTDMQAGQVKSVFIFGGNPAYSSPVDVPFAAALSKVPVRARIGLFDDETAELCNWVIPETHFLEAWGDARGHDGTAAVVQPLIAPLYENHSANEIISAVFATPRSGYDLVRDYWKKQSIDPNFEKAWEKWLNDGVIPGTASQAATVTVGAGAAVAGSATPAGEMEIIFHPDPTIWDGRYANNGWLQELPKPITKLTWDNAAMLSPATADSLKLAQNDLVELEYQGKKVEAPVWVLPGHPDNSVTVHFGYGRKKAGRIGTDIGFNAYSIWNSATPGFGSGLKVTKTGNLHRLVTTQTQWAMEGRDMVRYRPLEEWVKKPHSTPLDEKDAPAEEGEPPSMYNKTQELATGFPQWGMAIDMTACIGCNACTVACQAENNIPVVGKEQVANGRHMNWIRIDRYYEAKPGVKDNLSNPRTLFQPVPCMQCEKAPCEPVCPVGATVHSREGLNQMVYNRCVGTRYCSNNCPYKVRRFNFLNWANHHETPVLKLLNNPDVTVRGRGVMEKCTYCVQRINAARIDAKKEDREIKDGEIVPACAQSCPTHAISFGNISDRKTEVSQWKAEKSNYSLLEELNTTPRTTYLERVYNPNPALEPTQSTEH